MLAQQIKFAVGVHSGASGDYHHVPLDPQVPVSCVIGWERHQFDRAVEVFDAPYSNGWLCLCLRLYLYLYL